MKLDMNKNEPNPTENPTDENGDQEKKVGRHLTVEELLSIVGGTSIGLHRS